MTHVDTLNYTGRTTGGDGCVDMDSENMGWALFRWSLLALDTLDQNINIISSLVVMVNVVTVLMCVVL